MEYPKIQTLFKRDEKNLIIPGSYTLDEFLYLEELLKLARLGVMRYWSLRERLKESKTD